MSIMETAIAELAQGASKTGDWESLYKCLELAERAGLEIKEINRAVVHGRVEIKGYCRPCRLGDVQLKPTGSH